MGSSNKLQGLESPHGMAHCPIGLQPSPCSWQCPGSKHSTQRPPSQNGSSPSQSSELAHSTQRPFDSSQMGSASGHSASPVQPLHRPLIESQTGFAVGQSPLLQGSAQFPMGSTQICPVPQ